MWYPGNAWHFALFIQTYVPYQYIWADPELSWLRVVSRVLHDQLRPFLHSPQHPWVWTGWLSSLLAPPPRVSSPLAGGLGLPQGFRPQSLARLRQSCAFRAEGVRFRLVLGVMLLPSDGAQSPCQQLFSHLVPPVCRAQLPRTNSTRFFFKGTAVPMSRLCHCEHFQRWGSGLLYTLLTTPRE